MNQRRQRQGVLETSSSDLSVFCSAKSRVSCQARLESQTAPAHKTLNRSEKTSATGHKIREAYATLLTYRLLRRSFRPQPKFEAGKPLPVGC